MSELKKITVVVKNYDAQASGDLDALYGRVRLEDELGNTFYFKQVVVPKYLRNYVALVMNRPRTWYYKHATKSSIIIVAVEASNGKVGYDLDDLRLIARSTMLKGIVMSIAAVPAGIIAATATFGLGLIIVPIGFWYGYRNVFRLSGMLSRKRLVSDFAAHGIVIR